MSLPFFYEESLNDASSFSLSEETSKHITQVLRMKSGEQIQLTNGKGKVLIAEIIAEHKKSTEVKVITTSYIPHPTSNLTIAISLIKNSNRFEWFLEKATEIGIAAIIPLICERTEKQNFRKERMKNILVSAMLQSQQSWLPILHEPTKFPVAVKNASQQKKYIAHCIEERREQMAGQPVNELTEQLILIGPEGDFTKPEIEFAIQNDFIPVSLGKTRLRTETAGMVAAVLLNK